MSAQENKQLRSCPFCGSTVNARRGALKGTMFFKCTNKKSCGAVIFFDNDYYKRYPEEAPHRYNRRVDDTEKGGAE